MVRHRRKLIWVIVFGVALVVIATVAIFVNMNIGASPTLYVSVRTHGFSIFSGKEINYCIYDNGRVKEVSGFTYSDTLFYYVDEDYSNDTVTLFKGSSYERYDSGDEVNRAREIMSLLQDRNIAKLDIERLYIIGSHYYFNVFSPGFATNELYEYNYISNSISKIADFGGKYIVHVQSANNSVL
jgi:hypothetical protein